MLEEFENRGFTLKTHQLFSVHTTREECKSETITRPGKLRDYYDAIIFAVEKFRFQNVSRSQENKSRSFQIFPVRRALLESSVLVTDYCGRGRPSRRNKALFYNCLQRCLGGA